MYTFVNVFVVKSMVIIIVLLSKELLYPATIIMAAVNLISMTEVVVLQYDKYQSHHSNSDRRPISCS